jgi:hypothetical protein
VLQKDRLICRMEGSRYFGNDFHVPFAPFPGEGIRSDDIDPLNVDSRAIVLSENDGREWLSS